MRLINAVAINDKYFRLSSESDEEPEDSIIELPSETDPESSPSLTPTSAASEPSFFEDSSDEEAPYSHFMFSQFQPKETPEEFLRQEIEKFAEELEARRELLSESDLAL